MKNYLVNLYSWENSRLCGSEDDFLVGDEVIAEGELGNDLGKVELAGMKIKEKPLFKILRKATKRDIEAVKKNEEKKLEILNMCKSEIKRLDLKMKLVDIRISIDGSGMLVVFTAEGRVDFRELVRNLSRIFHRSIKMHQIGSRDEARKIGGCGICGRELCCVRFSGNLPSITTEMARIQKISHRGSERISGACGRLMCCLVYEAEQYREMLEGMPEINSFLKTKQGKGEVIEINAIRQEIGVRLENGDVVKIKKDEL